MMAPDIKDGILKSTDATIQGKLQMVLFGACRASGEVIGSEELMSSCNRVVANFHLDEHFSAEEISFEDLNRTFRKSTWVTK